MKIEPMKNHIDRTSENLAEMRDRTTDPQLKELLETALDALEDVGARLDELELEQENYWSITPPYRGMGLEQPGSSVRND